MSRTCMLDPRCWGAEPRELCANSMCHMIRSWNLSEQLQMHFLNAETQRYPIQQTVDESRQRFQFL